MLNDTLGDYMKKLEKQLPSASRAEKGKPLIARLDGRAFHSFTRGLQRPFDAALTQLMQETTQRLVKETNALIGYTQSDEITLIWYEAEETPSEYIFGGRWQKLNSILASTATGYFVKRLPELLPEKKHLNPVFDCRVWQVPSIRDAYLALLWRENDAIKNSITMVALAHFSHKQLQNVNGEEKKRMLAEIGHPWEDYDTCYRKGSYFQRTSEERFPTDEEMQRIPEEYRPTSPVIRHSVTQVELPTLASLRYKTDEEIIQTIFPSLVKEN